MEARARYSAFAYEWEILVYFVAFQGIMDSSRKTQKSVTDFRESRQEPQSAFVIAQSSKDGKKKRVILEKT